LEKNSINPYINRELSWLDFNSRVLEEAVKESNPPLERKKYLSIYSSNMDEFYMVRVGSLYDQSISNHDFVDPISGLTPDQQLQLIYKKTREIDQGLIDVTPKILKELEKNNIKKINPSEIDDYDRLEDNFERKIMPILTIMVLDGKHPFPYISNKSVLCGVRIKTKNDKKKFGVVLFPKNIDMVYFITKKSKQISYILLEEIIELFVSKLFKAYTVMESGIFKVIRNADLILDDDLIDENEDYKEAMAVILKRRKMLMPVRLQTNLKENSELVSNITENFGLSADQVFYGYPYLYSGLAWDLIMAASECDMNHLLYKKINRVYVSGLAKGESIIHKVLEKDYMMFHPFERFEIVIALLREAARDPYVISIKQTLYRVGDDSAVFSL